MVCNGGEAIGVSGGSMVERDGGDCECCNGCNGHISSADDLRTRFRAEKACGSPEGDARLEHGSWRGRERNMGLRLLDPRGE